jgi:general nucleoside transport system permease protein
VCSLVWLGLGYTGIAVAVLARFKPLGIVIVSVLIAALINSGSALQSLSDNKVPAEVVDVMVGMILIFALVGQVFVRNRLRFRFGPGRPMTSRAQVSDV